MYTYIYIVGYIYICMYIYIYIYIYISTYMYVRIHVYIHVRRYIYLYWNLMHVRRLEEYTHVRTRTSCRTQGGVVVRLPAKVD